MESKKPDMKGVKSKRRLPPDQRDELLRTLRNRFEQHLNRHSGLEWAQVEARLKSSPGKLWSLNEMETTRGEPDVVGWNAETG